MDRKVFFDNVRASFGRMMQSQVDGYNVILDEALRRATPIGYLSYDLATTFWETGRTMEPVREKGSGDGPDADPWDDYLEKYDTGKLAAVLGNTPEADGDGVLYAGGGYVQLTGARNYRVMGELLGIDLINNPALARKPEYAVKILFEGMERGTFTGKKLSDYINAKGVDYYNARRVVNGLDKAGTIAAFALDYEKALREAGYGAVVIEYPTDVNVEVTTPPPPDVEPVEVIPQKKWWEKLLDLLKLP